MSISVYRLNTKIRSTMICLSFHYIFSSGASVYKFQSSEQFDILKCYTTTTLLGENTFNRGTHREYCLKPLKHSIVERILVFKR